MSAETQPEREDRVLTERELVAAIDTLSARLAYGTGEDARKLNKSGRTCVACGDTQPSDAIGWLTVTEDSGSMAVVLREPAYRFGSHFCSVRCLADRAQSQVDTLTALLSQHDEHCGDSPGSACGCPLGRPVYDLAPTAT